MVDRVPLVNFLKVDQDHVNQLDRILSRANRDTKNRLSKIRGSNKISDKVSALQGDAVRAASKQYIGLGWADVSNVISNGQGAAAAAASRVVSHQQDTLRRLIADDDTLEVISRAEAFRAASTAETVLARLTGSQQSLSSRVYNTRALIFGSVDKTINQALAQGVSWGVLQARVTQFIDPNTPGGASYAAKRLARTEINNAFHYSTIQRYQDSGVVELVDWNLSGSHDHDDICDELRKSGPYPVDQVPKKPHPQCFCYITPHIPGPEDFLDKTFDGAYDDDPVNGSFFREAGQQLAIIAANRVIDKGSLQIESRVKGSTSIEASKTIDIGELRAEVVEATKTQAVVALQKAVNAIEHNKMSQDDKRKAVTLALEAFSVRGALPPAFADTPQGKAIQKLASNG